MKKHQIMKLSWEALQLHRQVTFKCNVTNLSFNHFIVQRDQRNGFLQQQKIPKNVTDEKGFYNGGFSNKTNLQHVIWTRRNQIAPPPSPRPLWSNAQCYCDRKSLYKLCLYLWSGQIPGYFLTRLQTTKVLMMI